LFQWCQRHITAFSGIKFIWVSQKEIAVRGLALGGRFLKSHKIPGTRRHAIVLCANGRQVSRVSGVETDCVCSSSDNTVKKVPCSVSLGIYVGVLMDCRE